MMAVSYKFSEEVPSKLEMQCKKGIYFSFDFGWYTIQVDIICLGTGSLKQTPKWTFYGIYL